MSSQRKANVSRIYLLIVWQEEDGDQTNPETWRFRLEEPRHGRSHSFVGVTAFLSGLVKVIGGDETAEEGMP